MTMLVLMLGGLLIWSPWINTVDSFIFTTVGEITPRNPISTVGGTLELNCTVFEDSGLNVSHLFWVANNLNASADTMIASGERTLLLRINITSIDEEGTYTCRRNDEEEYMKSIVKSTSVVLEYEPVRDVTNFSCIVDKKREEFHCSWELGLYKHIAYLNISVIMSPDNGMTTIPCPQMEKGQENCTWTANDDAAIHSMSKIVILNITNMVFNVTKSFRKDFTNQSILKPLPTRFINVTSMDTCEDAHVTWGLIPGGFDTSSQITLRSKWNVDPLNYTVNITDSLVVHDLVPAGDYTVEVRIKPYGGLYFSDVNTVKFVTCHKAPSRAPSMLSSGYFAEDCNAGVRTVTVYWQRIPKKFQNGPLTHYFVSSGSDREKQPSEASSRSVDLPCDGWNVTVTGCNQQGCSPNSSLYIPADGDVVPPEKVIMEKMDDSKVQLSWLGVKLDTVNAVDVVWCKAFPAVSKCQDEVHLLKRISNVNNTVIQADDVGGVIDNVIIGAAVLNERNISSGIKWQDKCRYNKDAVPQRIQTVSFLPDPPENSLVVTWSPINCDQAASNNAYIHTYRITYCKLQSETCTVSTSLMRYHQAWSPINCDQTTSNNAYIHMYRITYCKLQSETCTGDKFSVDVPVNNNPPYVLENLVAGSKYGVWVTARSLTKEGRKSEMKVGYPTNNDLSDGSIAGIVIGGMFVFVLVCAGIIFLCRQGRRKLGFDDTFPIEPIPIATYTNLPNEGRFNQHSTLPTDRSCSPLITQNGSLSNGDLRHNYDTILPIEPKADIDDEDVCNGSAKSGPKSSGMILSVVDVPNRQISKDSGRGSLSPTSTHEQPIPEGPQEKEQAMKEMVLNRETFPPEYSRATIVTNHCLHGIENYSYNTDEIGSPMDSCESSKNTTSYSSSNSVMLNRDYIGREDCIQGNQTDEKPVPGERGTSDLKAPVESDTGEPENDGSEVELTLGYVFCPPNNMYMTDGHQPVNDVSQCSNLEISATGLSNNTQTSATGLSNNTQISATGLSNNTQTSTLSVDQPVDTQTPSLAVDQPVDTQTPSLAVDQPVDTQTPSLAVDHPVDTQTPMLAADWPVDTRTDYLLLSELHENVCQPGSENLTTNNKPNDTVNECQANRGNSGDHFHDHDQLMDYVPNNASCSELIDGYVPHGTMDLSMVGDGPNAPEKFTINNSESDQPYYQECSRIKESDNDSSQQFSLQDAKGVSSDKTDDTNYGTSNVSSTSNLEVGSQSTILSPEGSSNVSSEGDGSDVHFDSSYIPVSALLQA